MNSKIWKLKTSDLPLIVELSAANGDVDYLEMKLSKHPAKGAIGAFLNRVSGPLQALISRNK